MHGVIRKDEDSITQAAVGKYQACIGCIPEHCRNSEIYVV